MTAFHVLAGPSDVVAHPEIRRIGVPDVFDALRLGVEDFRTKPSHYVFLCLIYPIAGVVLATWSSGVNMLPILYPLASGFALLGPIAAIGLYEISRRREQGLDTSWQHAFKVRHSPALPAILAVAAMLFILFVAWLVIAQALYVRFLGEIPPASLSDFVKGIIATDEGFSLMLLGNAVGFVFAAVVLATVVVSFPLLLDRDVGAVSAVQTSIRATIANPVPVAVWGLIVATGLVLGSLPVFVGLAVVMPILGHSTWHLYRKLVEPERVAERSGKI